FAHDVAVRQGNVWDDIFPQVDLNGLATNLQAGGSNVPQFESTASQIAGVVGSLRGGLEEQIKFGPADANTPPDLLAAMTGILKGGLDAQGSDLIAVMTG